MRGEIVALLGRLLDWAAAPAGGRRRPDARAAAREARRAARTARPANRLLVRLRRRVLLGMLRIRRRRLPVVGLLIAPARRHRRAGAGDLVGAAEADQPAHRCQIDPPSAVRHCCRPSPAHRSAAAPKQREQFVKHVGCPAPGSALQFRAVIVARRQAFNGAPPMSTQFVEFDDDWALWHRTFGGGAASLRPPCPAAAPAESACEPGRLPASTRDTPVVRSTTSFSPRMHVRALADQDIARQRHGVGLHVEQAACRRWRSGPSG